MAKYVRVKSKGFDLEPLWAGSGMEKVTSKWSRFRDYIETHSAQKRSSRNWVSSGSGGAKPIHRGTTENQEFK